ncbi:MAG: hypothetical protein ABIG66_00230 [Candidatus Kerfeldbacteria bacterium]
MAKKRNGRRNGSSAFGNRYTPPKGKADKVRKSGGKNVLVVIVFVVFILGLFIMMKHKESREVADTTTNHTTISIPERLSAGDDLSRQAREFEGFADDLPEYGVNLVHPMDWEPEPFPPIIDPEWKENLPSFESIPLRDLTFEFLNSGNYQNPDYMAIIERFNALMISHPHQAFGKYLDQELADRTINWQPYPREESNIASFVKFGCDEDDPPEKCIPLLRVNPVNMMTAMGPNDLVLWWTAMFHEHLHSLQAKMARNEVEEMSGRVDRTVKPMTEAECTYLWAIERQAYWEGCRMGFEYIGYAEPISICGGTASVEKFDELLFKGFDGYKAKTPECIDIWAELAGKAKDTVTQEE